MDQTESPVSRRRLLKTGAGTATGLAATTASGAAVAQSDAYGGHLSNDDSWDGTTADATGMDELTVGVGTEGNNGSFAFDPSAVLIEPGTTITWEWTGAGGAHNVVHDVEDGRLFDSGDPIDSETETFESTFEEGDEGVYPYICVPHVSLGMKGVVVVGEDNAETELSPFGDGNEEEGLNTVSVAGGAAVFGVVGLLGVAAYRELLGTE